MHYVFLDESYPRTKTGMKIVMAAWAVEQDAWRRQVQRRRRELYRTPILDTINTVFESLGARGIVATASLNRKLVRSGESDGTDDITQMSRTDNVWSVSSIFALGALIREFVAGNQKIRTVDIHSDPKSLKPDHARVIIKTFRELLVPAAKQYAIGWGSMGLQGLNIRKVDFVNKPRAGVTPNKLQLGTWIAHVLCSHSEEIAQDRPTLITCHDMSDEVGRTIQQFDGIPFSEKKII
jgi:hypothetical protein